MSPGSCLQVQPNSSDPRADWWPVHDGWNGAMVRHDGGLVRFTYQGFACFGAGSAHIRAHSASPKVTKLAHLTYSIHRLH